MKKVKLFAGSLLLLTIFFGLVAFGLKADVPQKVKDAFAKKFPSAKSVKWDKESDTEWEAEFKMKGVQYSANFLENGTWKETEHEIRKSDIPINIKTVLDTQFSGYKIEESEISETNEGTVYEFELEKGELTMEVGINNGGKVVKKEIKDTEEDEN